MRKARSSKTIRDEVAKILKAQRIKAAPIPIDVVAESLGARVKYSPFDGELAGMLLRGDRQIVIGVNSFHHENRQRFTIAHECGHLVLHKGKEVHIDKSFRVNKRDEVSSQATDPEEIEANRFAAEILMPFDMVMADLHFIDVEDEEEIKALARKYQVSVQAMTHRVSNLLNDVL
jgi:Zn-dependent peptidase ImmA (M78 family)